MRLKSGLSWALFPKVEVAMATVTQQLGTRSSTTNPLKTRVISYALLALVFFLLGFLPLWVAARGASAQLAETQHALRLNQLHTALSSAVIDAQQGQYETALSAVSQFYTALQAEIDRGEASAFSPSEQAAALPLLSGRDELIALLARRDPAGAVRLLDLYQAYGQIQSDVSLGGITGRALGPANAREALRLKHAP